MWYIDGLIKNGDAHTGGTQRRRLSAWRQVQVDQQVFFYWNIRLNKLKTNLIGSTVMRYRGIPCFRSTTLVASEEVSGSTQWDKFRKRTFKSLGILGGDLV